MLIFLSVSLAFLFTDCVRDREIPIEPVLAPQIDDYARPVMIDTDMGFDDVVALLFLLARSDIDIKAITICTGGLVHGEAGIGNLRRLLWLTGRSAIPIGLGRSLSESEIEAFPDAWRSEADSMLTGHLPLVDETQTYPAAVSLMESTLEQATMHTELIALGPLDNVAGLLMTQSKALSRLSMITVMGGNLLVPGNAPGCNAEWNFYVSAASAQTVLRSHVPVTLVPLDATRQVPMTRDFYLRLKRQRSNARQELLYRLMTDRIDAISEGEYDFWDALASGVAVDWSLGTFKVMPVDVLQILERRGAMIEVEEGRAVRVMLGANRERFESIFLETLEQP